MKNKEDITNLIYYALDVNNIDKNIIDSNIIDSIIAKYNDFKKEHQNQELDTFTDAKYLLNSIYNQNILPIKNAAASIAIDAAYKMCETPQYYVGKDFDIPIQLEIINIKEIFKDNMDLYNNLKDSLMDVIINERKISIEMQLEYFYKSALKLKHKLTNNKNDNIDYSQTTESKEKTKVKSKFFGKSKK